MTDEVAPPASQLVRRRLLEQVARLFLAVSLLVQVAGCLAFWNVWRHETPPAWEVTQRRAMIQRAHHGAGNARARDTSSSAHSSAHYAHARPHAHTCGATDRLHCRPLEERQRRCVRGYRTRSVGRDPGASHPPRR
ncbi:MAG: hypothetical protein Q9O62_05990 [Ardenticatenia bacterium]|nr:hypothetical protein [Ardenticatenia bacterium]